MYHNAELQHAESTNCRTTYYDPDKLSNYLLRPRQIVELLITTPPYWAAHFSDNYPLRGVLRLG
jgi:hypothetical protein